MLKEVYHLVHQWGSRSFFKKINLSEIDYLNVKEIILKKVIPYVICVFLRIQKFKCCCKCIYDPGLDLSGTGRWSNFSLSPWDGLGGSLTTENLNLDWKCLCVPCGSDLQGGQGGEVIILYLKDCFCGRKIFFL